MDTSTEIHKQEIQEQAQKPGLKDLGDQQINEAIARLRGWDFLKADDEFPWDRYLIAEHDRDSGPQDFGFGHYGMIDYQVFPGHLVFTKDPRWFMKLIDDLKPVISYYPASRFWQVSSPLGGQSFIDTSLGRAVCLVWLAHFAGHEFQ